MIAVENSQNKKAISVNVLLFGIFLKVAQASPKVL